MQFAPALCSFCVATCAAWKSRSASLHGPGTTITGVTLPSSLVTRLVTTGCPARLRAAPSSPPPNTIASCVRSPPVRWIASIPGCAVRYAPTSAPPSAMRTNPSSISEEKMRAKTGARYAFTGLSFSSATLPCAYSAVSTSSGGMLAMLPAPSTSVTKPSGCTRA